jgi:hypothetical protein
MNYTVHHPEYTGQVKINLCRFELLIEVMPVHNPLEAGYVWAPYIPVFETPQIILGVDPIEPSHSMASRYATKMIDNRFYGTIQLAGS